MGKASRRKKVMQRIAAAVVRHQRENGVEVDQGESQQQEQAASQSPVPPEARLALVESFDRFAGLRNGIRRIAEHKDEWAGIPMPLDGEQLVIEPTYPQAAELMAFGRKAVEPTPETFRIRNEFYSSKLRTDIVVYEHEGKIGAAPCSSSNHLGLDVQTLGASYAWGIEQERNALLTLGGLVQHYRFKGYLLTGLLLETSPRSNVTYIFRKLRPTIAMRPNRKGADMRILAALCMHPIGYYAGSWAGAMCPTDDLIAHLMLMRGDEPMFWRRCNQHPPHSRLAGL